MVKKKTKIDGVFILEPRIFADERGYFVESYNAKTFLELGITCQFVQDNEAKSSSGVIRGLHYQESEFAQAKLVRVTQGRVLDVIVDVRKNSRTYGKCITIPLSSKNMRQVFIPRGCAHGYSVLSKYAVFVYKCDNYYNPLSERGIHPLDPTLQIDWKIIPEKRIISQKDLSWPKFSK
ncbi:MAG: dTDP-4-dehydrorhamnose 3,5-epimerase [Saprospiraceae bacterium]|nr:dTDP-4-dehydrorhamnose 3,5-epimerase [Saprospiraceae bacterium]